MALDHSRVRRPVLASIATALLATALLAGCGLPHVARAMTIRPWSSSTGAGLAANGRF